MPRTSLDRRNLTIRRAAPLVGGLLLGGWVLAAATDRGRATPGWGVHTPSEGHFIRSDRTSDPTGWTASTALPVAPAAADRPLASCRLGHRPAEGDLEHLEAGGRVRCLDLSLARVTDADLASLGRATGLRELDLFGTSVGDAGLAHLAGLTDLRALYVESTRVGDAGLVHLARLRGLESLALSGTRITDAGLVHLRGLVGLRALDVSWTEVSEAGIEDLRRALPGIEISR
jgi:hypothetical protein